MAIKKEKEEQTALQKLHAGLSLVCLFAGSPLVKLKLEKKHLILSTVGEGTNGAVHGLTYRLLLDKSLQLEEFEIGSFCVEGLLMMKAVFGRRKIIKATEVLRLKALTPTEQALQLSWARSTATIPLHMSNDDADKSEGFDAKKAVAIPSSVLDLISSVLKRAQLSLVDTPNLGLCPVMHKGKRTAAVDVVLYGAYAAGITRVQLASVDLAKRVCPDKFVTIPAGVMQTFLTLGGYGEDVTSVIMPQEANVCVVTCANSTVILKKQDTLLDLSLDDITELTTTAFESISGKKSGEVSMHKMRESMDAAEAFCDTSIPTPSITVQYANGDLKIDSSLNSGTTSTQKIKVLTGKTGKKDNDWKSAVNVPIRPMQKLLTNLVMPAKDVVRFSANDTTMFFGWQSEKVPKTGQISAALACLRLVTG